MSNDDCTNRPIYLDYHSTTPVDPRVAEKVMYYMTTAFGNPSSVTHCYSDEASAAVETARAEVAKIINAEAREVIFTSGATESINIAIQGWALKQKEKGEHCRIAVLPVEHKAVLETCKVLSKKGFAETVMLKVDEKGRIDLDYLEQVCAEGISLICVMAANNEIGNIYPVKKIGEIARKYNAAFFCDATQGVGKFDIDFKNDGITMLALSGHKMYGPKGVGALVIRKGYTLGSFLCGGGQQKGVRPGTLNVSGIAGLGEACRLSKLEMEQTEISISSKRDRIVQTLKKRFPEVILNGDIENKLSGNISMSVPGIKNEYIIEKIRNRLAISTGSACSAGVQMPSHVLTAMGLPKEIIDTTLRLCVGKFTTDQEIDRAIAIISEAIEMLRPAAVK